MKNRLFASLVFLAFLFLNSCKKDAVAPETDLSVAQTASTEAPAVGANVTFTITVQNSGPDGATGVMVSDILPAGFTLVSATPASGTWAGTSWTVGNLASGASATLTVIAKVNATGSYVNNVSITGAQADPVASNNSSSKTLVPVKLITYMADVKPIFVVSCTPCHMPGGVNPNKWDDYATAKGKISVILDRVQRAPGTVGFMPKVGSALTAAQIATLKKWVTDGLLEN